MFKVGIIGLGYVGLPLAVEIGKKYETIGYDVKQNRIKELKDHFDRTDEVSEEDLRMADNLTFSDDPAMLVSCNLYIITVPTPIDKNKKPDLSILRSATGTIGKCLKKGDIVIYESTVYPGTTEEVCVPILELESGLEYNKDFFCGYSPERINPGDKAHRLPNIMKVTSGSTPEIAKKVDDFYKTFIDAGTHLASNIKVAEAAKAIENAQRDINIAFVNELSLIFEKLNIDTQEVLKAAGTKWNFLKFTPGLVGGHCIGVDPYYLTFKAEEVGYKPQIILAGRKVNDDMGMQIAQKVVKLISMQKMLNEHTRILIMGITFKENCPDVRNTKVIDIVNELESYNLETVVHDPLADKEEVLSEYGIQLTDDLAWEKYTCVILAVSHDEFMEIDWSTVKLKVPVVYDVKGILPTNAISSRL